MSHFYGSIPVSARRHAPTASAHKSTGLVVRAASLNSSIVVKLRHHEGRDLFEVVKVQDGISHILSKGVMD